MTYSTVNNSTKTYKASLKDNPFDVFITPHCLAKLNQYARAAQPCEIGGLAKLEIRPAENGRATVFVMDVHMFKQEATGGSFEIDSQQITEFMQKLIKEDRTDEIAEWCSIVHSHPIGMSPQMSGVDVDAIKRYAAEEDAFSLIITASATAATGPQGLLMHYCTNVRGQKVIIEDIPVHMAYMNSREDFGKKLAKYILKGIDAELDDTDKASIESLTRDFVLHTLPGVSHAENERFREEADEAVKTLIQTRHYGASWRRPPAPSWSGQGNYGSRAGENSNVRQLPRKAGDDYLSDPEAEWYTGLGIPVQSSKAKQDSKVDAELERLCNKWSKWNDVVRDEKASNNAVKKAKRELRKIEDELEGLWKTHPEVLAAQSSKTDDAKKRPQDAVKESKDAVPSHTLMPGDWVTLHEDAFDKAREQCVTDEEIHQMRKFITVPKKISDFSMVNQTLCIGTWEFYDHELCFTGTGTKPDTKKETEVV